LQRIEATGASVSSLTEFAAIFVVVMNDDISGTEFSIELPSYWLAEPRQNFRFLLYLSGRTIRPPTWRVKFRWRKWEVCPNLLMQLLLDGNPILSP